MSNYLIANVHFVIFEEHHKCNFKDDYDGETVKKTITYEYRKAMRSQSQNSGWAKAKHTDRSGWCPKLIAMDGSMPGDVSLPTYRQLPPVPLHDLLQKAPTQMTLPVVYSSR